MVQPRWSGNIRHSVRREELSQPRQFGRMLPASHRSPPRRVCVCRNSRAQIVASPKSTIVVWSATALPGARSDLGDSSILDDKQRVLDLFSRRVQAARGECSFHEGLAAKDIVAGRPVSHNRRQALGKASRDAQERVRGGFCEDMAEGGYSGQASAADTMTMI